MPGPLPLPFQAPPQPEPLRPGCRGFLARRLHPGRPPRGGLRVSEPDGYGRGWLSRLHRHVEGEQDTVLKAGVGQEGHQGNDALLAGQIQQLLDLGVRDGVGRAHHPAGEGNGRPVQRRQLPGLVVRVRRSVSPPPPRAGPLRRRPDGGALLASAATQRTRQRSRALSQSPVRWRASNSSIRAVVTGKRPARARAQAGRGCTVAGAPGSVSGLLG